MDLDDVRGKFPRWHTWVGVSGLLYASRGKTSPPAILRAETPEALLALIEHWEAEHRLTHQTGASPKPKAQCAHTREGKGAWTMGQGD